MVKRLQSLIFRITATMRVIETGTGIRSAPDQPTISPPYRSFSITTPMISISAPLRGRMRGVIAADLKLDTFSELVNAQRPGEHGTAIIFDSFGTLIAHPDFARLVEDSH